MTNQPKPVEFVSSICRHTGRECPAALAAAQQLARADAVGRSASPDFEMTGQLHLTGCSEACPALFRISPQGIALFCGVEPDADIDALEAFAHAFLSADSTPVAWSEHCTPPLAFVVSVSDAEAVMPTSAVSLHAATC